MAEEKYDVYAVGYSRGKLPDPCNPDGVWLQRRYHWALFVDKDSNEGDCYQVRGVYGNFEYWPQMDKSLDRSSSYRKKIKVGEILVSEYHKLEEYLEKNVAIRNDLTDGSWGCQMWTGDAARALEDSTDIGYTATSSSSQSSLEEALAVEVSVDSDDE